VNITFEVQVVVAVVAVVMVVVVAAAVVEQKIHEEGPPLKADSHSGIYPTYLKVATEPYPEPHPHTLFLRDPF
jgi:hypothetical protein